MNKNIVDLVMKYKQTNSQKDLNDFFVALQPILIPKARFLYYTKWYKIKHKYFKLCNIPSIDFEDILSEINIEVLNIIQEFDCIRPFENYFYMSLWKWRPSFLRNRNFLIQVLGIYEEVDENNSSNFDTIMYIYPKEYCDEFKPEDLFNELTKDEKKIVNLLHRDSSLTHEQLSENIGVTRSRVTQLMDEIRKKYKNN